MAIRSREIAQSVAPSRIVVIVLPRVQHGSDLGSEVNRSGERDPRRSAGYARADLSPPELRGASSGLRQCLNAVGAFLGPVIAIGLMLLTGGNFTLVFWGQSSRPFFFCVDYLRCRKRWPRASAALAIWLQSACAPGVALTVSPRTALRL
jgi:hypothetical protein